jgi:hypothetical protein
MRKNIKSHKMTPEGLSNLGGAANIIGFTLGHNPEGSLAPKRVKLYTELLLAFSNEDLAQVQRMLELIVDVAPSETPELAALIRTDGLKLRELLQEFPPTEAAHWQAVRRELAAGWGNARMPLPIEAIVTERKCDALPVSLQAGRVRFGHIHLFGDVSGSMGPSPEEMVAAAQMHDAAEPGTFGVRLDSGSVRDWLQKDTSLSTEEVRVALQRILNTVDGVKTRAGRRLYFIITDGELPEEPKR